MKYSRYFFIGTSAFLIIVVFLIVVLLSKNSFHFAKPFGTFKTTENNKLKANINNFMEVQKSTYALGKENYHCGNKLYGYDDKYAYAWIYCSGFIVNGGGELEQGSAFGMPIRLEYTTPDLKIIKFDQPMEGANYNSSLQKLFPQELYEKIKENSTSEEFKRISEEVRNKALESNKKEQPL